MNELVFIYQEGKFNDNSFLIDGYLYGNRRTLSIYLIENEGKRMLIDTFTKDMAVRIVEKLKQLEIYPIHKILLTHSHWDHIDGVNKLRNIMKDVDIEVLASENAIGNLKEPASINDIFEVKIKPIDDVTPLKDGDLIDLNGLKLKVINFFGHTMDSIALFDEKNKNIFTGDAIIDKFSYNYVQPTFMPPDFNESELLTTFQKLREMKNVLNSISLAHYGVWTDGDFEKILDEMEELHFNAKNSIIKWYNEKLSSRDIAIKYFDKFIPNSKIMQYGLLDNLERSIKWLIEGLKRSGII